MPHKLAEYLGGFPFLLILADGSNRRIKMNWSRVLEAVLIAAATAMLTAYVSMKEMRVEVANIKCTLDEHKAALRSMDERIYAHVTKRDRN